MIYIDLMNNPPDKKLIDEGKQLTEELKKLSPDERADFIDKHHTYWGKLKKYYMELSHNKCWYTEAKEIASSYHMDHFRPKKAVMKLVKDAPLETTNKDGAYWWLAFDWENYRLSASIPNSSKNAYFPLKEGTVAAVDEGDLSAEWIGLLDPTNEDDVELLTFNDDGKACAACTDDSTWDAQRVQLSVRVYDLNAVRLVDERKMVRNRCKELISQIKAKQKRYAKYNEVADRDEYKKYIEQLRAMMKPEAELSAVAIDYVLCDEEPYIRKIALKM